MVSGLNLLGASQGTAGWRQGAKQGDQAQQSIIQMSRVRARLLNSNVRDTRFLKNRFLLENRIKENTGWMVQMVLLHRPTHHGRR